jgi:hypothetical protein
MKPSSSVKLHVCYADDSYFDEVCKIASTENNCMMDWLQDVGMTVNTFKTEAMYF